MDLLIFIQSLLVDFMVDLVLILDVVAVARAVEGQTTTVGVVANVRRDQR